MILSIKALRWYWIPTVVLVIGIISIIMMLEGNKLNEKKRADFLRIDALADARIRIVVFHVRLEEAMEGDTTVDRKKLVDDLDEGKRLLAVTLMGGRIERGLIPELPDDEQILSHAKALNSLVVEYKELGLQRLENPEKGGIGSEIERRFDKVFRELLGNASALESLIEAREEKDWIRSKRIFIGVLSLFTFIAVVATIGLWILEKRRRAFEQALVQANEQLSAMTGELVGHRSHLSKLVDKRTVELSNANELLRDEIAERMRTEEALKERESRCHLLSTQLLKAQEVERRRISVELHDELGQDLNAVKIEIRLIERGLREDQLQIKRDCERLLSYMDHVIEEVRRLSMNLSPTVLEDLGLTAALRRLAGAFEKNPEMKVVYNIEEIDHLLPRNHWIVIYRVVQEALTNVARHSRAKNTAIAAMRSGDAVIISVEDDGKGFDPEQITKKGSPETGFGLAAMHERAVMIGGILEISSAEGTGTYVSIRVPGKDE